MNSSSESNSPPESVDTSDNTDETTSSERVPATSYVSKMQYDRWKEEANSRNQSLSSFISTMVEFGLNDINLVADSPNEINELRSQLRQVRSERDELEYKLNSKRDADYTVGLGRIKELIIKHPGIDKREIINHVSEHSAIFVENYLQSLSDTEFKNEGDEWYPPKNLSDDQ